MRLCYRIAAVRRQVKQLVAIAEKRAAQADGYRGDEAETQSIAGADLLAAPATVLRS